MQPTILAKKTANKIIVEILENMGITKLIYFIVHPFIDLKQQITYIINDRHPIKSSIICSFIIFYSFLGCYLFVNNLNIYTFYNNITVLFHLNNNLQHIIACILSFFSFAHLGKYLGNIITKVFCKLVFGDANFYVTEKKLNKMLEQFHLQGYININKNHILTIIDFCKKNLNELNSKELGAKYVDWQQTLECLIYEYNIEHFMDQQLALHSKKLEITTKIELVKNCDIDEENLHLTRISPHISPQQYSLPTNTSCSIDESFNKIQKEFDKFKENYLKNHRCYNCISGPQLLHQYQCYLNYREINTSMGLYPSSSMEKILFNSFCNSYYSLYNSTESSRNNSIDNTLTPNQPSLDSDNSIILYAQEHQFIIEQELEPNSSSSTVTLKLS